MRTGNEVSEELSIGFISQTISERGRVTLENFAVDRFEETVFSIVCVKEAHRVIRRSFLITTSKDEKRHEAVLVVVADLLVKIIGIGV